MPHPHSPVEMKNSYNHLCKKFWTPCEFCDEYFPDRFSSIKHNATHIIIPLIKQTVHQCNECLFHFTSIEDLNIHITKKHHKPSKSKIPKQEILKSMIEKQVVIKCKDEFRELNIQINGTSNVNEKSIYNPKLDLGTKKNSVNARTKLLDIVEISSDEESMIVKNSPKSSPNSKISIVENGLISPDRLSPNWDQNTQNNLSKDEKFNPTVKRKDNLYLNSLEICQTSKKDVESRPNTALSFSLMFKDFVDAKLNHRQSLTSAGQLKIPLTVTTSESKSTLSVSTSQKSPLTMSTSQKSTMNVSSSQKSPLSVSTSQVNSSLTVSSTQMTLSPEIKEESIDFAPMKFRIQFEEDNNYEEMYEPEEILPDRPCLPRKVIPYQFGVSEPNSLIQNMTNGLMPTTNSLIQTKNSKIETTDSLIHTLKNEIQHANGQIDHMNMNSQYQSVLSQILTSNTVIPASNRIIPTSNSLIPASNSLIPASNSPIPTLNSLIPTNTSIQDPAVTSMVIEEPNYAPSIHFDDLIEPGDCKCRYCKLVFANRIELIKHEVSHIRLTRPRGRSCLCTICDRHIAGNYLILRRHIATNHPNHEDRKLPSKRCATCHLTYHDQFRHIRNYHQIYNCGECGMYFEKEKINLHNCSDLPVVLHKEVSKMVHMCEICLVCARKTVNLKRNSRTIYDNLSEQCVLGMTQKCDMCCNSFFSVNVVKKTIIYRESKIKEIEWKEKHSNKKKPISNKDRLTSIRKRIKMMKFYVLGFIFIRLTDTLIFVTYNIHKNIPFLLFSSLRSVVWAVLCLSARQDEY